VVSAKTKTTLSGYATTAAFDADQQTLFKATLAASLALVTSPSQVTINNVTLVTSSRRTRRGLLATTLEVDNTLTVEAEGATDVTAVAAELATQYEAAVTVDSSTGTSPFADNQATEATSLSIASVATVDTQATVASLDDMTVVVTSVSTATPSSQPTAMPQEATPVTSPAAVDPPAADNDDDKGSDTTIASMLIMALIAGGIVIFVVGFIVYKKSSDVKGNQATAKVSPDPEPTTTPFSLKEVKVDEEENKQQEKEEPKAEDEAKTDAEENVKPSPPQAAAEPEADQEAPIPSLAEVGRAPSEPTQEEQEELARIEHEERRAEAAAIAAKALEKRAAKAAKAKAKREAKAEAAAAAAAAAEGTPPSSSEGDQAPLFVSHSRPQLAPLSAGNSPLSPGSPHQESPVRSPSAVIVNKEVAEAVAEVAAAKEELLTPTSLKSELAAAGGGRADNLDEWASPKGDDGGFGFDSFNEDRSESTLAPRVVAIAPRTSPDKKQAVMSPLLQPPVYSAPAAELLSPHLDVQRSDEDRALWGRYHRWAVDKKFTPKGVTALLEDRYSHKISQAKFDGFLNSRVGIAGRHGGKARLAMWEAMMAEAGLPPQTSELDASVFNKALDETTESMIAEEESCL
jgi:hypothetical protein